MDGSHAAMAAQGAAALQVPQRDLLHVLKIEWRKVRESAEASSASRSARCPRPSASTPTAKAHMNDAPATKAAEAASGKAPWPAFQVERRRSPRSVAIRATRGSTRATSTSSRRRP
jgi:hypothetical protein